MVITKYSLHILRYLYRQEPIPAHDDTLFKLSDLGIAEVESKQWFNTQFVLTQIVLPIIIAVITTLITIFLAA